MKKNNININIQPNEGDDKKVGIFKAIFNYISELQWNKILKVYFVMFFFLTSALACYYLYSVISDKELIKETTHKFVSEQSEEDIRDNIVTPKIQHELNVLTYSINADRSFIFELHNGKKNTSGLPFRFADMTYEETNEEKKVDRVAMQFQDIPLTLYKYPHFLQREKIIVGTIDEIEEVDSEYAKHIREIGGKYLGMIYMNSNGIPLGFLCVSYHDLKDVPSKEFIINKLTEYGKMITHLLDLGAHVKNNEEKEI